MNTPQELKEKTVRGVWWTATDTIMRYGVSFVVGIILARLISPDEYGLIGILTIFIYVFEIIIDGGLINALIRKQDAREIDFCTVFYTNLILSVFMAGIIFTSAGLIADFFERQELVPLTRVMSFIVVINALALVQKARLTKKIDFKSQTKVTIISATTSGVIGVIMAYYGYGVWALVGQIMSNSIISTILFWVVNRWVPKLQFSTQSFKEMWSFGWKLLVSGILNTVSTQIHNLVIGKCFTPATLGQYTRAQQFGSMISSNITTIVQKVTFPVLSEIQSDPERLKMAYKRVIKITVFPTFVVMMCLAACAKPLLIVLIGEKWLQAAYLLQILCFSMMLYPLHLLNLNAIQVMGRSDLTLRINVIKNLLIVFPVITGICYGIYWMIVADVIRGYIGYYLNAYYTKFVINYSVKEQIKDIWPSFRISISIALPLYLLSFLPLPQIMVLSIQVIMGILLTICLCELLKMEEYSYIKGLLLEIKKKYH